MMNENTETVKEILEKLKAEIIKILKDKFVDMILFGSYSRGDFSEYSDVDILVLVKDKLNRDEDEKLDDVIAKYSLNHDIVISCIVYPQKIFKEYNTPFILNVREEGIKI